ncbi:hypothetical protein SeMB42_g03010 [Synchytrium endobioticum]|uniref:Transcription factor CBF/NF-Y/archaeal histone domain-containing protein n=1 Tax=Synchytrium endobioticum TaxID=286115 RepID=A0A507DAB0_9FUNG|nr:hypothetical protein SeLEV6574_g02895 [Synchytrium endobioticum]TPX48416.1 hypothetical protein SeMB42_g03010 [Synchytrium endobioticum]
MPPKKNVRSRFPATRIKKIMRLDEEVGKVAQATPIVISKAVEMFLETVVSEMCKETQRRNAKKAMPGHLKTTIMTQDRFDFLRPKVAALPDAVDEAAEPAENEPGRKKKRSAAPGNGAGAGSKPRKKKDADAAGLAKPVRKLKKKGKEDESDEYDISDDEPHQSQQLSLPPPPPPPLPLPLHPPLYAQGPDAYVEHQMMQLPSHILASTNIPLIIPQHRTHDDDAGDDYDYDDEIEG